MKATRVIVDEETKTALRAAQAVASDDRTQDIMLRTAICDTEIELEATKIYFPRSVRLAGLEARLRGLKTRFHAIKTLKEMS